LALFSSSRAAGSFSAAHFLQKSPVKDGAHRLQLKQAKNGACRLKGGSFHLEDIYYAGTERLKN
jgi:hypothetical protein